MKRYALFRRLLIAKDLPKVRTDIRVVFEYDIDEPVGVLVPDPNWLAAALHGNILPPVEVYHALRFNEFGECINGELLHCVPPIGPMTLKQAIEYLIKKDVPTHIWNTKTNRPKFKVCRAMDLPADRASRADWTLDSVACA